LPPHGPALSLWALGRATGQARARDTGSLVVRVRGACAIAPLSTQSLSQSLYCQWRHYAVFEQRAQVCARCWKIGGWAMCEQGCQYYSEERWKVPLLAPSS
jgi:hypothetical protein